MGKRLNKKMKTGEGEEQRQARSDGEQIDSQGLKFDGGKPPMSLLPGRSLRRLAEVMAYGRVKYNAHNWRKGINYSRVLDAALRHLSYVVDGEFFDKESNLHHVAHAAINLIFLLEYLETCPEHDDLYKGAQND